MDYSYSPIAGQSESSTLLFPLLPTVLIYKHQIINYPIKALVDSGAESCYCLKHLGDYLRIDFSKKKQVTSIAANNTKFMGFQETIHLLINGKKIEASFIFSDQLNPEFPVVLGQKGFFSNFKVCFNKTKNEFSVD